MAEPPIGLEPFDQAGDPAVRQARDERDAAIGRHICNGSRNGVAVGVLVHEKTLSLRGGRVDPARARVISVLAPRVLPSKRAQRRLVEGAAAPNTTVIALVVVSAG